jgi:hypothetical protein
MMRCCCGYQTGGDKARALCIGLWGGYRIRCTTRCTCFYVGVLLHQIKSTPDQMIESSLPVRTTGENTYVAQYIRLAFMRRTYAAKILSLRRRYYYIVRRDNETTLRCLSSVRQPMRIHQYSFIRHLMEEGAPCPYQRWMP